MKEFDEALKTMKKIHDAKAKDYAKSDDPYSNFRMCEELGICSVEEGFLVRMSDKLSRLAQLTKKEADVKDESMEDTCMDLAVYAIRLLNYLQSKNVKIEFRS